MGQSESLCPHCPVCGALGTCSLPGHRAASQLPPSAAWQLGGTQAPCGATADGSSPWGRGGQGQERRVLAQGCTPCGTPARAQSPLVEAAAVPLAAGGRQRGRAAVKGFLFAISCCYKSNQARPTPARRCPVAGGRPAPSRPQHGPAVPSPHQASPWPGSDARSDVRRGASAGPLALLPPGTVPSMGDPAGVQGGGSPMPITASPESQLPPSIPGAGNDPFSLVLIWFWFELS